MKLIICGGPDRGGKEKVECLTETVWKVNVANCDINVTSHCNYNMKITEFQINVYISFNTTPGTRSHGNLCYQIDANRISL